MYGVVAASGAKGVRGRCLGCKRDFERLRTVIEEAAKGASAPA